MKIIKRYANRKLYDTERSCYVTLDEIATMVREGDEVKIVDQKTEEDLTSITLTQIIFEEEKKSRRILPLPALRRIIQGGGDFLQRLSQPVQQFREDTQRQMDRFLRPAEVLDEGRQAIRDYALGVQRAIDDMQKRIDQRVKDAIDNLTHVPELEVRVGELNERIDRLEKQLVSLARTVERLWDVHVDTDGDRRWGRKQSP
jgi:polyhydroxyalkanoate synthesis repressor PhaR